MAILDLEQRQAKATTVAKQVVYRHRLATRIWHWLNAAVILVMLMSGLMIFNAHPRLYWGQYGANPDHAWLQIGHSSEQGFLRVGDITIPTTGLLGAWGGPGDERMYTAFPSWLTLPSTYDLALSRRWHLTFAWLFVIAIIAYWIWGLVDRHIWQDLVPAQARAEPAPHPGRREEPRAAAISEGRGCATVQHASKAGLSRRRLRPHSAPDPDRADHVAGDGRVVALAHPRLRRTTVRTIDPLHLRDVHRALLPCALVDGRARWANQRDPVNDYRPVPSAGGARLMARPSHAATSLRRSPPGAPRWRSPPGQARPTTRPSRRRCCQRAGGSPIVFSGSSGECARAGIPESAMSPRFPNQRQRRSRGAGVPEARRKRHSPIGGFRSRTRRLADVVFAWPISGRCRREPRSPATTASKAGAPSASGPASSSRTS